LGRAKTKTQPVARAWYTAHIRKNTDTGIGESNKPPPSPKKVERFRFQILLCIRLPCGYFFCPRVDVHYVRYIAFGGIDCRPHSSKEKHLFRPSLSINIQKGKKYKKKIVAKETNDFFLSICCWFLFCAFFCRFVS
jgi:hypothetical protein